MANAELKTKATGADVGAFLKKVTGDARRADCVRLVALMEEATGAPARLWGPAIVGFGDMLLTYPSGRELDWFVCGFAARKDSLVLYGLRSDETATGALLAKLGKHKTGKGCVYVKTLADIDVGTLRELLARAVDAKTARRAPRPAAKTATPAKKATKTAKKTRPSKR
jgi:hypothetical protein